MLPLNKILEKCLIIKTKVGNGFDFILNAVVYVLFLGIIFSFLSLCTTIVEQQLYVRELCISDRCLGIFFEKTRNVVSILQATAWLVTLIATLGGVGIAIMTYVTGVSNSNLTNHISHLNMFRDYVNAEIGKRKFLSSDKINIYKWYSLIFPLSKKGSVIVSDDYKDKINNVMLVIKDANNQISSPSGKYVYNNHQISLIEKIDILGIKMSICPKNEFILIEEQIFDLIDCINVTFTDLNISLSDVDRAYI